jgi:rhamnogalacturonyl hydrolase YesR
MRFTALASLLACPLILAGAAHARDNAVPVQSAAAPVPWTRADVLAAAEKAADYQIDALAHGVKPNPSMKAMPAADGWEQGAFFVGLAMLADHSPKPELAETLLERGKANGYAFGARQYDADDQTIGAAYFWDARHGAGPQALAPMRARLDAILAHPPTNDLTFVGDGHTCRDRWCWADALFMGPQVWFEMSRATGDPKYAAYAKNEFFATVKALYDPQEHLFYRDSRFFDRRDINGAKLFWSRGDGWVFAGIARMLDLIPADDPDRPKFVVLFREMAAKLKSIQKPDGFWSPSLLGDPQTALPEESGTAFYTYGMAWGVKNGVLDRAGYEPVVRKGWAALNRCLHPDGRVGYVQPVSDRPDAVDYDDTQFYGVGGFLMAASMVADLDLAPIQPIKALVVDNPSAYDQPAAPMNIAASLVGADNAKAAGGWSVVMNGRVYAAQWNPARGGQAAAISFVLPLKAHARAKVQLVPQAAPLPQRVQAILNVKDDGAFHLHQSYHVPTDPTPGQVAFDGVGWESDRVAYRARLDGQDGIDVLRKTGDLPVLQDIGQGAAAEGFTALGGLGEVRAGTFVAFGARALEATAHNGGPVSAEATVVRDGVTTDYTIGAGSALTFAAVSGAKGIVAAGLVHTADASLTHATVPSGWSYIAVQDARGSTGSALFLRTRDVTAPFTDDGQTVFVTFRKPPVIVQYVFAAWTRGDGDFATWLKATADGLAHPATVSLIGQGAPKRYRKR